MMDEKGVVKQIILDKSLQLFSAKGYEGVSVSGMTKAAGITKPTLYYYFGSKKGVFEAVCQSHYAQLNALITENAVYNPNPKLYSKDILLALTKLTTAYFSFAKENEHFYRIALANLSMPSSSAVFEIIKKYHFTQFEVIENMFLSMAKTHSNLKGKSKTLTWSFIGTINSYISLYLSGEAGQELGKKNIKELVHQFMHGIHA